MTIVALRINLPAVPRIDSDRRNRVRERPHIRRRGSRSSMNPESPTRMELENRIAGLRRNFIEFFRRDPGVDWDTAEDYLGAKAEQTAAQDPEKGRQKGMTQFLDEKSIRPGLQGYKRDA